MKLNSALLTTLLLFCFTLCFAQKAKPDPAIEKQRIKLAKQSAIDNFEVEIESVQLPAVRSFIYYQLAIWLWKDGKDDTGYALRSAVKALEVSIEDDNWCSNTCLKSLVLLEKYAPETKKRLVEKYKLDDSTNLRTANLSAGPDSDRSIADKLTAYLNNGTEPDFNVKMLLEELADRNSTELPRVLEALLGAEEQGRTSFSADNLLDVVNVFRSQVIPGSLRLRFYSLVVQKAMAALNSNDDDERRSAYDLVNAIYEDARRSNEGLFNQISLLRISLTPEADSVADDEEKQACERIEKSSDKLAATIAEAEATENKKLKTDLYMDAYGLALGAKRPVVALDMLDKLVEMNEAESSEKKMGQVYFIGWREQSYGEVADLALKVNNLKVNERAISKLIDDLFRARALKQRALYFFDKNQFGAASDAIKDAIKMAREAKFRFKKISDLLQLIPATQKIDKDQVFNVTLAAVKTFEFFPRPEAKDDKGQAEKEYASTVAEIDLSLYLSLSDLLKKNRSAAIDMANRIERKEFKVAASLAMLTDELNSLQTKNITK